MVFILKVINNNVVSALDESGEEIVVMGKGVGFAKKPGTPVDEGRIEKRFFLEHSVKEKNMKWKE